MKQQVIFLHGGIPKENYKDYYDYISKIPFDISDDDIPNWNKTLWEHLGNEFHYISFSFPEKHFADYKAWKIHFLKLLPHLQEDTIIITSSLGSTFLLKYLGEYEFPVHIKKLFFLAAALHDTPDEVLGSFWFELEKVYTNVSRWARRIYIYHSQDDKSVPFEQWLELKGFFPESEFREFYNRGHWYTQTRITELEEDIKD